MRYKFGGTGGDWAYQSVEVIDSGGQSQGVAAFKPGSTITFWAERAMTTPLVVTSDAGGVTPISVTANAEGFIVTEFYGPDNVSAMYASAGGGPPIKLLGDLTPALASEAAARLAGDDATLASANAYTDANIDRKSVV